MTTKTRKLASLIDNAGDVKADILGVTEDA